VAPGLAPYDSAADGFPSLISAIFPHGSGAYQKKNALSRPQSERLERELRATICLLIFRIFLCTGGPPRVEKMNMTDYRVSAGEAQEDQFTAAIEKCTSQIPSSAYLGAALSSMTISVGFKIAKKDHMALFVGQWAAPFLLLGIYNKLVKQHGSDASTPADATSVAQ
jgi:hypothetical protein